MHHEVWLPVQITPAMGWDAVYRHRDGSERTCPLACWVIEEASFQAGTRRVVGYDAGDNQLKACSNSANFVRYQAQHARD